MSTDIKNKRVDAIFKQITQFAKFNFKTKLKISKNGDGLDPIINDLNKLGKMLEAKNSATTNDKKRINSLLEILIDFTTMDFSKRAKISDKGDELDALAVGINTLVEELAHYIQETKKSKDKLRIFIENIKDYAMYMIDKKGNIMSWNKGAEYIKGYSEKEVIGKNFSIFYLPEEVKQGVPEDNLKIAKDKGRYEFEGCRIGKNGIKFWAQITLTAMYDDFGNLLGFSKITRDITERKNAERILEEKKNELLRSNAELEQFAYVASHDLQEPLRMITSYMQLIEKRYKDKLDEDGKEFIHYAVDGSNRMRNLIYSLLEYSRVNRVKPFEYINMDELLKDVLQNLKTQTEENKAIVLSDKLPDIYGDSVLINQLFQNLISNALKFKGEKTPEIIISGKSSNNEYLFAIKDNGIGIQKAYTTKIFEIFQRLHNKIDYPGTGIGLAICKKIVEKHKGKIWVESEVNKGSTFYFTIKKVNN